MAKSRLELLLPKDFMKALQKLKQEGGLSREVFKQVKAAMTHWGDGLDTDLALTDKGESRLAHVVKYNLKGQYRLVVREHAGSRILLYVGDHEDVERWLNANRGKDFVCNRETGEVAFASVDRSSHEMTVASRAVQPVLDASGQMFAAIPRHLWKALALPPETELAIARLAMFESCDEESNYQLMEALNYPTPETRQAVLNAYLNLAQKQTEAAVACIARVTGTASTASEDPEGFEKVVVSGEASASLLNVSKLNLDELEDLLSPQRFSDWMLYLTPEQLKLVTREYTGPARLVGVSGSGKTCVLVHRANHLARKYPGQRMLILTLGRSLVRLIRHLLDQLCSGPIRSQITIMSVYDYCYRMVKSIEPNRLIEQQDPRSGEDLVICWQDFMAKEYAERNVDRILAALKSRDDPVRAPESYVHEELIWIRSGFGKAEREQYLDCDRPGRGIGLPKWPPDADKPTESEYGKMPPDARRRLINQSNI